MAQKWRFYLADEDGTVTGTDNLEVALVAKRDGSTLVIEPGAAEYVFDGDVQPIEETDEDAYLGEAPDDDDGKEND